MVFNKIIIVPKMSKFEYDIHRLNLNQEQMINQYKKEKVDVEKIIQSHERQHNNLNVLKDRIPQATIISREHMNREHANNADLVIPFGGDNHFQYVSHFLDKTTILGVNSDPFLSEGALTSIRSDKIDEAIERIKSGNFTIENWTRLQVWLNETKVNNYAISEIFIGEERRRDMSRHILEINRKKEEQKSSGIIITTGSGSTGWYDSSIRYLFPEGNKFDKKEKYARFLITEPYRGKLNGYSMLEGKLDYGQELNLYSLNDSQGNLLIDCLDEFKFLRGDRVKIKISDHPLRVISLS